MNVLVAGGAGYIGSHAVKQLIEAGHHVVAVDNLFRGHAPAVDRRAVFHKIDLCDTQALADVLTQHGIQCVMHFAALAYVGESVADPLAYYDNNTAGTISLLKAMDRAGVKRLVFSSTCATYGEPETTPIVETMRQEPVNPYGWSKLFVERVLRDYAAANRQFAFVALRYFNVAGARVRRFAGRGPRPGNALDSRAPAGRVGEAREGHGVRHRLSHARRHVHPRLHPRRGPLRGPPRGHERANPRRHAVLQSGHRPGLLGQGGRGIGAAHERRRHSHRVWRPATRRPGDLVCQRRQDSTGAWLVGPLYRDRRRRRRGLELAEKPSRRLREPPYWISGVGDCIMLGLGSSLLGLRQGS